MAINLNQSEISKTAGTLVVAPNLPLLQARIASSQATPLTAGMVVKFAGTAGDLPQVVAAAVTDKVAGVVLHNEFSPSFAAGDMVSVASVGDVVRMQSTAAAIAAGAYVEFDTTGKVLTSAGTNTIIGMAENAVPAAGGIVSVKIIAPIDAK